MLNSFSNNVKEILGYYVYLLIDPRDNKVFYVGKGVGDRVFSHQSQKDDILSQNEKIKMINEIEKSGNNVIRKIVKFDLKTDDAYVAESTLINYIGIDNLTNKVLGHHGGEVLTVEEFEKEYSATPVIIEDDAICIKVNQWYREITDEQLYEVTNQFWRINVNRANKFKIVFAVNNQIIRGVFEVDYWRKSMVGDYHYTDKRHLTQQDIDTWAGKRALFSGKIANKSYMDKYLNKDISKFVSKIQNPISYVYKQL